jgi:hypothetical protein
LPPTKTAVCTELQRRGYQAIHGDRELVYRGDPETGLPAAPETGTPTATWMSEHQIWDVEKVQAFVANQEEATFFCGSSRNFAKFIDLFDGVFVLEVDLDTMNRRIDERVALDPTDSGGKPEERELLARLYATKEDVPKGGVVIDATAPIERVVDEILEKCNQVTDARHSRFQIPISIFAGSFSLVFLISVNEESFDGSPLQSFPSAKLGQIELRIQRASTRANLNIGCQRSEKIAQHGIRSGSRAASPWACLVLARR